MAVTVLINGDKAEEAAVSQDSLLLASQQCGVARSYSQLEAARLLLRRRLTLVLIVLLFLLAAVILTASVVHDVRNRRLLEAEWAADWEEVECEAGDADCEAALCPRGMVWSRDTGQCRVRDGHQCCTLSTHEYLCFPSAARHSVKCLYANGVVPSAYKQNCKQGFLWVAWKRKCVRRN